MKTFSKIVLLATIAICSATTVFAQSSKENYYPNWFVGAQAGGQAILGNGSLKDYATPSFGFQVGRWVSPTVGVRLHAMGYKEKGYTNANELHNIAAQKFDYKSVAVSFDFLFNMTNILWSDRASQNFNWNMLTGFGGFYSWDFDEPINSSRTSKAPNYQYRLGTQLEYLFNKHLGVNLELQGNYKSGRYNLSSGSQGDVQAAAFLGLTYRFGTPKKVVVKETVAAVPQTTQSTYDAEAAARAEAEAKAAAAKAAAAKAAAEAAAAKAAAEAAKVQPLEETVFFTIGKSAPKDEAVINKVVEWCNKYTDKNITVSGYADKGTGTASVNKRISSLRAKKVADAIKAKGVAADRISISSYGDTVQPFSENDKNRCTIVLGK